ncbi:hypothetical protein ACNJQJ_22475, partial [Mycobacterium tuberculosis]
IWHLISTLLPRWGFRRAVPREFVLGALRDNQTWSTPAEYIEAIDALPLGPNVSSLLGHSDLRTAVLGLDRATDDTVRPTDPDGQQRCAAVRVLA